MRVLAIGSIVLCLDLMDAVVNGRHVTLSPEEVSLLELLIKHRDAVVTRSELMMAAWGSAAPSRVQELDDVVRALQAKVLGGGVTITSVPGIGYSLR